MKHGIGRKLLSVVLAVMMLVSLLPTAAFADDSAEPIVVNSVVGDSNTGNDTKLADEALVNVGDTSANEGEGEETTTPVSATVAKIGNTGYATLADAIAAANNGDTITLGEGTFTTCGNTSPNKSLTFVGAGTDKTTWVIGDLTKHANPASEANGDHSFDGCATITFKEMTLKSDSDDYRGFVRIGNTVVEDCVLEGKTAYWGYETAKFVKSTFKAPEGDYALWDYSTKDMSFDDCTFAISGKGVNVYVEAGNAGSAARKVTVNGCTVNSSKENKAFLNIKNSTQAYDVTFSGTNTVNGLSANGTTNSNLYQVETTEVTATSGNPVTVKEKAADGTVNTVYEVKAEETSNAVAKIGDVKYETLKDAIDAANTGDTIVLLMDVDLKSSGQYLYSTRTDKKDVHDLTFDLNGHKITSSSTSQTVTASREGLVIKNGTIENTAASTKYGAIYATFSTKGTHSLTLENVTVIAKDTGIYTTMANGNATVTIGGKTEINAKTGIDVVGAISNSQTRTGSLTLNVSGGTVTGAECGIHVKGPARKNATAAVTVNVTGGEVSSITTNSTTSYLPTNVNISGGTVTGELKNAAADVITISGGTFKGTVRNLGAGSITITGGKFTSDVSSYVPEGYEYDRNTGMVKEAEPTGVAKIGNTVYATLPEAVKSANAGDTIVLLDDIALTSVQTIGKQLTIDLNGKTISSTGYQTIRLISGADLTVKDSGANGKITNAYKGSAYPATIYLKNAGTTFTLESGTIESDPNETSLQSVAINSEKVACTVNISGGSVTVPEAATEGRGIVAGKGMTLNISGGTITGGLHGVDAYGGSTTNITGGTISARIVDTGVIEEAYGMRIIGTANVTVDGGEITGVKMDDNGYKLDVPNVTLKSGKIKGSFYSITKGTITFTVDDNATITFANDTAKKFLPDTVELVQNEDGSYGVKAAAAKVAKIGDKYYPTLADAIAAAEDGDTITLLADVTENVEIAATKKLTLDLNGYTLNGGTGTAKAALTNYGTITIQDSSADKSGTIKRDDNGIVGEISYYVINNKGTMTIESGTVSNNSGYRKANSTGSMSGSSLICNGDDDALTPVLNIEGGKFVQENFIAIKNGLLGTLNVSGGEISSKHSAIQNWYKATITGGTINGQLWTDAFVWAEGTSIGETKIGGNAKFTGEIVMDITGTNVIPKLEITDGELNVTKWNITTAAANAGAKPAVSGGKFTSAVPENYCAEGFIPTKNADNTYGVKQGTYVAETKGVKYESLQAAIDAAAKNATVTMLANTRENVTIDKAMTLDLNGHTLNGGTEKGKPALTITARIVTIKDSSEAQIGTIMREDTAENSGVSSHYVIDIQGNSWVIFKSGTVKNGSGAGGTKGASLVRVGDDSVEENPGLVINGGTFTQDNFIAIKVDRGYLKLNGGEVNSANSYAVENWFNATIKGGTVNGAVAAWTYSDGTNSFLTIEGGTITGDVTSVNYGNAEGKTATVTITGGAFTGKLDTRSYDLDTGKLTSIDDAAKATIKVSGGTFNNAVEARYCDEGYTPVQNSDGKYGVQQQQVLAKIGDTAYYTMDEAFRAVQTGEMIVMQRDYTTGAEQYSGSKSFAIDLNGKTWTYTGTNTNHAAFEINHSDVTLTVKNGTVVSNSMVGLIPSAMGVSGPITYDNAGLVFEGVTMTANGHSGIETNGNNTNDTVTLKNSTLNVPNGFGIYFPSSGKLTIDNSTINAKTMGVQVCAGSLSINAGSAITVSGGPVDKTENDGAIQDGAAISIVNRTGYKGLDKIEVTGGKFTAKTGNEAIKAYDWANNTESTFTANDKVAVSGGTFSSAVKEEYCAPGYIPTTNSDGTYGVKEGVYVAKIRDVKYETLQEAINAAGDNSTVVLMENVVLTEAAVFPAGKKVNLDLRGHNITATGTALLINGKADIQSTGSDGVIESTGNVAVAVGNNAKVAVFSGTLKGREGAVITGTSTGATIEIRGSRAKLIATDNAVIAGNGSKRDGNPNTIKVMKGTLEGKIVTTGYIACGIYAPWNDNVTVSGGTFKITNGAGIVARAGTVKVTGGTFNCGDGTAKGWVGDSKNNVPNAALVFDKAANYPALTESSQILVSGGTFSTDPAANGATLATGYVATPDENGMYKVAKSNPVAEINGVKYDTLQAAINAAQATKGGATITLLKNIKTESYYTVNGDNPVTIDLAGYNITGSGISGLFYVTAKGDLTIKGKGTVTAVEDNGAAMAVWVRSPIAKVTLEGGTYTQQISDTTDPHFDLIYVERGNVYVKGGTYEGFTPDWTLNCKDENYQSKEAKIEVTGGTFYKFNPADCKTENNGTSTNFVKAGYVSTANTDGTYTVEEYKPVEVWTGYSGTKVASYATVTEAVANLGDNKWIVIGKDYTLTEDFTIGGEGFDNLYLDVAEGATLTVAEGVTLTVAANAKRLGVRDGATLVNKGTIVVCGSSTSNGFAMLYGTFTGNELTVPDGCFLDNNGKNFFATANENAVYEITFGDGTVKKTADSTNIKGGNVKQIKLLKDVTNGGWTLDSSSVGAEVVLDLNGHTLSYNGANRYYATLNVYTKVTIKNGTVKYEGSKRGAIDLVGQGDLTIESDVTINGGDGFAIFTSGTSKLTVNGKVTANGNYAIAGNGSKDAGGYIDSCDITVNDGATISAPKGVAIYHPEKGTVTINGGEISGHTGVQMCSGELIINDGSAITVNGNAVPKTENDGAILDGAAISIINRNYPGGTPKATITGGTFKAIGTGALALKVYDYTNNTVAEWTNAGDYVNVSGGTFSSEIQPEWCAEGFIPHDNGDGTYTVKSQYVAMIGDTKYTTLSEALKDAAKTGGTVLLVADVDANEDLVRVKYNVTLDLNGHSITNADMLYVNGQIKDSASVKGFVSAVDYVINDLNAYTPVYNSAEKGYSFFNLGMNSRWDTTENKAKFALKNTNDRAAAVALMVASADDRRVKAVVTFSWEEQGTIVEQSFTFLDTKLSDYLTTVPANQLYVVVNGLDQFTAHVDMQTKFVIYKENGAELFTLAGESSPVNY